MSLQFENKFLLAPLTSWNIGGPAEFICFPTTIDEVAEALQFARDKKLETTVLGGGSNVLIADAGVKGLTICLKKMSGFEISTGDKTDGGQLRITCLAGTSKSELLRIFLKYKLSPALLMAGLPGDVGGGVVMNAGIAEDLKPREFREIVDWVEVMRPSGEIVRLQHRDLQWSYRHSAGWAPGIIVRVGILWKNEAVDSILDQVKNVNRVRLSKQPLDLPSCGSVFVNPVGHKAAQLIDSCGLKGYTVGGAQVSKKHANFIVNTGGATAEQVWQVIQHVKTIVKITKGVELQTEVVPLGQWRKDN